MNIPLIKTGVNCEAGVCGVCSLYWVQIHHPLVSTAGGVAPRTVHGWASVLVSAPLIPKSSPSSSPSWLFWPAWWASRCPGSPSSPAASCIRCKYDLSKIVKKRGCFIPNPQPTVGRTLDRYHRLATLPWPPMRGWMQPDTQGFTQVPPIFVMRCKLYPNTQEYLESFDRPTTMGVNGIFSTSGDSLLVSFISRIRKSFPFFTVTVYFSKGATKKTGVGFHEV